jgi:hypothetical protein
MNVNLNISYSTFVNGFSQMGGAIYLSGASSVNISRSQLTNSYASSYGGAIYLRGFTQARITGNT